MTVRRHLGTFDTMPPGTWCDHVGARDGKLTHDVAYRCAGCGGRRVLFGSAVDDHGSVAPPVACDDCGTTQTLVLEQWDPDPC